MESTFSTALTLSTRCRRDALRQLRLYSRRQKCNTLSSGLAPPPPPRQLLAAQNARTLFSSSKSSASSINEPKEVTAARAHCVKLLETHDYPSSLILRLIPPYARDAFAAIRAFNIDVALVGDQTTSLPLGKMRMQWWSGAVDEAFGQYTGKELGLSAGPPREPVTVLLQHVLKNTRLSKGFFKKVISAREQYLGHPPFLSLAALETYAESTYSSLHYLTLESLCQSPSTPPFVELDHVASHIGKAAGIAAVLRGTPILSTPRQIVHPNASSSSTTTINTPAPSANAAVVLPLDICAKHSLRQEDVVRYGPKADGLKDVVFEVATQANDHLITAKREWENLKTKEKKEGKGGAAERAFAGLLPAVPTALYLKRLEKCDFDVFHPSLQRREWKLPWRLYKAVTYKEITL